MRATFINVCTATLSVLFALGCTRHVLPAGARVQTLGVIELAPSVPKRVALGDGRELVIVTAVLPDGETQLDITLEPEPIGGTNAPWGPGHLLMRYVRSGEEYDIPFGDRYLRFRPKLEKK